MAKPIYSDGTEALLVFKKTINKYHSDLSNARLTIVFNDAPWTKKGLPVFGELKKLSPLITAITERDFVGVINHVFWNSLSDNVKEAMVDHLLCGFTAVEDKEGNPNFVKVNPNIVEYSEIINRHGAYTNELKEAQLAFVKSCEEKKGE